MTTTACTIRTAVHLLETHGLHTGPQFIGPHMELDVVAAVYIAAEGIIPGSFRTNETAALSLIHTSAPTMQAIRAISAGLDTEPPYTQVCPGLELPEYVDHVAHWATMPGIGQHQPPTRLEVIGRLLRTADQVDTHTTRHAA